MTGLSPIVGFYRGERPDDRERTLAAIQSWDDARLEAVHDYIQWLFPLPERSAFNPEAPLLAPDDIAAFATDADLRDRLLASLRRMLEFYGLALAPRADPPGIAPSPSFPARSRDWLHAGNHNMLRLSRILRCLTLLGLPRHARALLDCLERIAADHPDSVSPRTRDYWRNAVRPPA